MIYIDIPMPKCCEECFALDDYGDYPFCIISKDQRGYNFNVIEKRMPTCPLRAQEPRVMTPEEVQSLPEGVVVWFEELDNGGRSYIQPMMSNGKAFMIGTHLDINVSNEAINWTGRRFWTSRPTKEQMEAVKWE